MLIRYCTATSKRTGQSCRARTMRGRSVCMLQQQAELPYETEPEFRRFMTVDRVQRAQLPDYPLTQNMAAEMFEALKEAGCCQMMLSAMDNDG